MLLALVLTLAFGLSRPAPAAAHPLGNFTTNQYARIDAVAGGLRLVYVLDLAEIPTLQEFARVDADGDGAAGAAERDAYLAAKPAEIASDLHLSLDNRPLTLAPVSESLAFPDGQAGLNLHRLRVVFRAETGGAGGAVAFRNAYASGRIGWRETVVGHAAGFTVDAPDELFVDLSRELRVYPDDLLSSPLDRPAVAFTLTTDPGAPASAGFVADVVADPAAGDDARPGGRDSGARFAALLDGEDLTAAGVVAALVAAAAWGAAHALSPGHGKTVVGAYLIGARGTPRHAAFLGLTVTITHTAGVLALGLVTLFASRSVVPERLFPWMSVVSGLLVVGMGLTVLRHRLTGAANPVARFGHHGHAHGHPHHDHDAHAYAHAHGLPHRHGHEHGHHDGRGNHPHAPDHHRGDAHTHAHSHGGHTHSHLPPGAEGERITWRGLLALGISGGLIPCPSALVVLLGAIALGKVGFGLLLVLAFSLGLAGALTAVGLLFLYAGRFLERRLSPGSRGVALLRYAPVAGAVVLTLAGAAILVRALGETHIL